MPLTDTQNALLLAVWEATQAGSPMRVRLGGSDAESADLRDLVALGFVSATPDSDGVSVLRAPAA